MADLIAQGAQARDRWRRRLPKNEPIRLGRADDTWNVPWDNCVSRYHARLMLSGRNLSIETEARATNPVFFNGEQAARFKINPGEHFVIGSTTFTLVDDSARVTIDAPRPVTQQTFSPEYLRQVAFRHARQQIDALTRLPEIVAGAGSDQELYVRLVSLLITGISMAKAVAIVRTEPPHAPDSPIAVLHWDRTQGTGVEFQPSGQLIHEAFEQQQSVLHTWHRAAGSPTTGEEFDWACCTPVPGVSCRGWAIYVAGHATDENQHPYQPEDFQDALKIVELVTTTVASVCDVRLLQRRTTSLAQFFSPPVRDALAASDPDVALSPRESDVSVLFCDLRGFSRKSEQAADDLFGLLQRVSESLGIMTGRILDHGGVIGDFHGDAAMGFWGWPLPQDDTILKACRAALAIGSSFEIAAAHDRHALSGFRVGMGLATGRAVAGKIGTVDQVKVTVFGPVVNVASRLENLTRLFGSSILTDAATARAARQQDIEHEFQVRDVAQVRPYGMQSTVQVAQLLPLGDLSPAIARANTEIQNKAVAAFRDGAWPEAKRRYEDLPDNQPVREFFLGFMAQTDFRPPDNWSGVISLASK